MTKPDLRWFDDWYLIEDFGAGLFGIGEPKYHQINWNYLVAGKKRALLFDTGPGLRDISHVVASLTDLPVTALLSHLHYDHSGNFHRFADSALADLPILRACERDGLLHAPDEMFLPSDENMTWVPHAIRQWWPIGHRIDLGERELEIIATPGHSPESISLFEGESGILLAADFLYLGNLYGHRLGASLPDYLASAEELIERLPIDTLILGAHGEAGADEAPKLSRHDLLDMKAVLTAIRDGKMPPSGEIPDRYEINDHLALLAGPKSYGIWRQGEGS